MHIRDLRTCDIEPAHRLLVACGWAARVGELDEFADLLAHSQRVAVAITAADDLVGFARALTDGRSNGYLSMVAVAPAWRRQGVGRALLSHVMGDNPAITWVLRAGREGAAEFFAKLGFQASSMAMERLRTG